MPENCCAERARNEAHRVDDKCFEYTDKRIGFRKEQLPKDQAGDNAVKKKVVPFNGGADGTGNDGAAQLTPMRDSGIGPTKCR